MFANTFKLESRPKWEMETLTLHEAVPGHHIQVAIAQELQGLPDPQELELHIVRRGLGALRRVPRR